MTVAADEQQAFEQLFRETRADLLAYALRRTTDPEDAADVVAQTYLIAWEKLDTIPRGHQARLWLFGVARNVLLRRADRQRSAHVLVERLADELRRAQATDERPEDARLAAVRTAVAALPVNQREILLLAAWDGLTPREIATVTATPVNLVRVRLHRARSRLKRQIGRPPADRGRAHRPTPEASRTAGPRRKDAGTDDKTRRLLRALDGL